MLQSDQFAIPCVFTLMRIPEVIGVARGEGPREPALPLIKMPPMIKMSQKSLVSSVSVSFSIFAYNSTRVQQ